MKKILYIEDEPDLIKMLKIRLEEKGYEFISTSSGDEGIRMAVEDKPDLILLDLFLPAVSGFEVCRRLKKDPQTKNTPLIVVTASGVDYVDEQCKEAGADGCVKKPYIAFELLAKIGALLSIE